jgi:hypothetical protein
MGMLIFYAGFFLVGCFVLFTGDFGEIGVSAWCFCGQVVVKRVGKVVFGWLCFG